MKSIKIRLLVWLLPTCFAVFGVAGAGVYYATKSSLEAELDARLSRLSGSARFALRNHFLHEENPRRNGPTLRSFLSAPEFQQPGQYFGFRSNQGRVQFQSKNLGEVDLADLYAALNQGKKYNVQLPNGDPVRVYNATVYMDSRELAGVFFVALSRKDMLGELQHLFTEVMLGLAVSCLGVALVIALALRGALKHIHGFSEQVRSLHENQLDYRFQAEALPAELVPIAHGFNDMISKLENSFEREKRFNGFLAHELRTPLAGLRLTSEVAAKWPSASSAQDFEDIAAMASRLQDTLDGLLLLSKLESAWKAGQMQEVEIVELVHELISEQETLHSEKRLEIHVSSLEKLRIDADASLLRMLLSNLISNAFAYTPEHGRVEVELSEDAAFFKISNPAPDFTEEDLARVFERLWRRDANRADSPHAGLGLSICQAAAKVMGFEVTATLDAMGDLHFTVFRKS